jgi:hypothetical protein
MFGIQNKDIFNTTRGYVFPVIGRKCYNFFTKSKINHTFKIFSYKPRIKVMQQR